MTTPEEQERVSGQQTKEAKAAVRLIKGVLPPAPYEPEDPNAPEEATMLGSKTLAGIVGMVPHMAQTVSDIAALANPMSPDRAGAIQRMKGRSVVEVAGEVAMALGAVRGGMVAGGKFTRPKPVIAPTMAEPLAEKPVRPVSQPTPPRDVTAELYEGEQAIDRVSRELPGARAQAEPRLTAELADESAAFMPEGIRPPAPAPPVERPVAGKQPVVTRAGSESGAVESPSYTKSIEEVRGDLVRELKRRTAAKEKLPVGMENVGAKKYVDQMSEGMARDWHSGIFDKGAEPPVAPKLPVRPQEQAVEPSRGIVQPSGTKKPTVLSNAGIERIRKKWNMAELPEASRRGWEEDFNKAASEGMAEDAHNILRHARKDGRAFTQIEHIAIDQKVSQFQDAIADNHKAIDHFTKNGQDAAAALESAHMLDNLDQLNELTSEARWSGAEAGRQLAVRRFGIDKDTWSVARVLDDHRQVKGRALTEAEVSLQRGNVSRLEKLESENKVLVEENARISAEAAKRGAVAVTQAMEHRVGLQQKTKSLREKILADRVDIKKEISALGYRVNDVVGASAQALHLAGRLAKSYIYEAHVAGKRGIALEEIVKQVRKDIPEFSERDVWDALNTKNPKAQAKAKSTVARQTADIQKQAELWVKIEDAAAGVESSKSYHPSVQSARVKELRKLLTRMRNSVYESGAEAAKIERAVDTLNRLQDRLANGIKAVKESPGKPSAELSGILDEVKMARRELRSEETLADLKRQDAMGDYKIPDRDTRPISPRLERNQIEIERMRRKIIENMRASQPKGIGGYIREGTDVLRTSQTTGDLSYNLRQNIVAALSHPITTGKAAGRALRGTFSKYTAEQLQNHIRNSPNWLNYNRMKLRINDIESHVPGISEETFHGSLLEKIPWLGEIPKAANRNMTLTGNLTRTALADAWLERNPNATLAELEMYGHALNTFTGIGDLSWLTPKGRAVANDLMFSPLLAVSRLQTPYELYRTRNFPRVRKQVARDLAGFVGTGTAILGLAAIALKGRDDAEVGTDPRNADWGKIRIGNTRFDIWGGFQQPARLVRGIMLYGTDQVGWSGKDLRPGEKMDDPLELIGRFAAFKISPKYNLGLELLRRKTAVGEPRTVTETMANQFIPLFIQDIKDAKREGGWGMAALATPLTVLGTGASSYPDSKSRITKEIRQAKDAGDMSEARRIKAEWNAKNPKDKIGHISRTKELVIGDKNRAIAAGDKLKAQKIKDDWNRRHPTDRIN